MIYWNPFSFLSSEQTPNETKTDENANEATGDSFTSLDKFDVAHLAILLRDDLIGYPFRNNCENPLLEHSTPENPLTMQRIAFVQDETRVGMLLDNKPIGWHAESINRINAGNFFPFPDKDGYDSLEQINTGWFYVRYDANGVAREPYLHYPESGMEVAYFPSRNTWLAASLTDNNSYNLFYITVTDTSKHRGDHVSFSVSDDVITVYERRGCAPHSCVRYHNGDAVEVTEYRHNAKGLPRVGDEAPNLRELFGEMIDTAGFEH